MRAPKEPTGPATGRRISGATVGLAALAGLAGLAWAAWDIPAALGGRLTGTRADRAARSPQFRDGVFHNRAGTRTMVPAPDRNLLRELIFGKQKRRPTAPVPLVRTTAAIDVDRARELNVVWYGHASALIEIEGRRVLLDPVWSDRCSPSAAVGPRRLHEPPVRLDELPNLDAILISHDHYDHLDMTTVQELTARQSAPFLVPLGVGAHLDRWGVPADRIVELDWAQTHRVNDMEITCAAAQHFSGRGLRRNGTLWSSWVVAGRQRVEAIEVRSQPARGMANPTVLY
ncbi:MBL fold metallo-hydrolase, partial [Micromonospora sp. NPDC051296]|uniref:MBL fold metallo-hydrolase n=1 Tax=Micromonospora sp. NPDC051296 TaxID=3155046 RepID=UPI00343A0692